MNQKERMLAELPYKPWLDGLEEERIRAKMLCYRFNQLPPDHFDERDAVLKELLGPCGEGICIEQPFHCPHGRPTIICMKDAQLRKEFERG